MKKLLLLLLIPSFLIGQTEKEDKLLFRNNLNISKTSNFENTEKQEIRNLNNSYKNPRIDNASQIERILYSNYETWHWRRWGAPVGGFIDYYPIYYYDRFGLRQPGRVYTYPGNKTDTILGERKHLRLGLSYSFDNQLGGWIGYGNKSFFIIEYSSYLDKDKSSFLPNLTMDKVIQWNDKRLKDIVYGGIVYVGGGIKINRLGFYIMPGYGWQINNFQFFDEFFILSNNGQYSFPNYTENYFTGKLGAIYDYKKGTAKIDYNPFRNILGIGVGIIL